MQTTYNGEHSIIFGDKHSWEDWGLVPASLPIVAIPGADVNVVRIPGSNGFVDLTDILRGCPSYSGRTGTWDFIVASDKTGLSWPETYSMLASYLHGKEMTCRLTDDRSYFYTGRFTVKDFKASKVYNTIQIEYALQPFKQMIWTTCQEWEWDPFDFIYGEINQSDFMNIPVEAGVATDIRWNQNHIGNAPVTPRIIVASFNQSGMKLKVNNTATGIGEREFDLEMGTNVNPLIEFSCPRPTDETLIHVTGEGLISFDFRPGRL